MKINAKLGQPYSRLMWIDAILAASRKPMTSRIWNRSGDKLS